MHGPHRLVRPLVLFALAVPPALVAGTWQRPSSLPSQAQETAPIRVATGGAPRPDQEAALERVRLEQGLVLAERTARMLRRFEAGLERMHRHEGER